MSSTHPKPFNQLVNRRVGPHIQSLDKKTGEQIQVNIATEHQQILVSFHQLGPEATVQQMPHPINESLPIISVIKYTPTFHPV